MTAANDEVDSTFYIQLTPEFYAGGEIRAVKASRMTLKRPWQPRGGAVVVKLTLRLPKRVFQPFAPDVVVAVPADLAAPVVGVTVEEPEEYEPHDEEDDRADRG